MIPHAMVYIILSPLLGAILVSLLTFLEKESWRLRDATCFLFLFFPMLILISVYPDVSTGGSFTYELGSWSTKYGIALQLDGLSFLFAMAISVISMASYVFSLGYLKIYASKPYFYFYYLLMITGLYGLVLSGDIFNLYAFFELTVATSYVLITFTGDKKSFRASFSYLVISGLASSLLIMAIAVLYNDVGTLNIEQISSRFESIAPDSRNLFFALFFGAIAIKSALIPFHFWLPNAHAFAPTPISAILSGLTVKVGAYILIRFLFILSYTPNAPSMVMAVASLSAVLGAVLALMQHDIKKLLAYHSISQIGLVFLGIAALNIHGLDGAILHIINHGLFKALLFLCAGAVIHATGTRDLRHIKSLPGNAILILALLVGSLSIMGIPPMNGFFSKELILESEEAYVALQTVVLVTTTLTVASFSKLLYYVLIRPGKRAELPSEAIPLSMTISLMLLAPICIVMGVLAPEIVDIFISPVSMELLHEFGIVHVLDHPFTHLPVEIPAMLVGPFIAYLAVRREGALERHGQAFHLNLNSATAAIFVTVTLMLVVLWLF